VGQKRGVPSDILPTILQGAARWIALIILLDPFDSLILPCTDPTCLYFYSSSSIWPVLLLHSVLWLLPRIPCDLGIGVLQSSPYYILPDWELVVYAIISHMDWIVGPDLESSGQFPIVARSIGPLIPW